MLPTYLLGLSLTATWALCNGVRASPQLLAFLLLWPGTVPGLLVAVVWRAQRDKDWNEKHTPKYMKDWY